MKIALCISGQPRGLSISTKECLEKLIKPLNADVFIHSWYSKECDNKPFSSTQHNQQNNVGRWTPETDKIIIESIKPKKYKFEHPREFSEFNHLTSIPEAIQTQVASLFYGINEANELKKQHEIENNFIYDIVIRTRLDLIYKNALSIDLLKNLELDDNTIYVPFFYQNHRQNTSYSLKNKETYGSLSDIFIIGNSKSIDKTSDLFLEFEKIHDLIFPNVFCECYIGYNVKYKHKIQVKMIDYYMDIMHRIIKTN
jgi:hypothetical protein